MHLYVGTKLDAYLITISRKYTQGSYRREGSGVFSVGCEVKGAIGSYGERRKTTDDIGTVTKTKKMMS